MSDWIEELSKVLKDSNVKISFSKNCCSGIVPLGSCQCWRCRGKRGEHVDAGTEAIAEQVSKKAQVAFRNQMMMGILTPADSLLKAANTNFKPNHGSGKQDDSNRKGDKPNHHS